MSVRRSWTTTVPATKSPILLLLRLSIITTTPTPYIAAWHQAPVGADRDLVRLTWQITSPRRSADRLKFLAGSEAAMGAWVGDTTPEDGAALLCDALARVDAGSSIAEPAHRERTHA